MVYQWNLKWWGQGKNGFADRGPKWNLVTRSDPALVVGVHTESTMMVCILFMTSTTPCTGEEQPVLSSQQKLTLNIFCLDWIG